MCLQSSCLVSFTFGGNSDSVGTLCPVARLGDDTMGAAVQQIADWLEKLGMSEYAQRFAENGINVAALPHLTDQDLKDIGVLLGHRRVMLAAISKLAGAAPATPEPTVRAEPKPQDTAERRQVTVMFSDLVGSTALSARMDPEDLREVISAYQKCVAETVRRFGGFVAKYMGDGVLVYFGYPQAHEDDAERAVRAGLELDRGGELRSSRPFALQTRVGIATGLVVVGDLIGSGEAQERGIVGETPNLAARLQGHRRAEHGGHCRGHAKASRQSVRACRTSGQRTSRASPGRVRAFAALRASSVEGRFEALHASGLTDLVGREEELELLLRRWSKSKDRRRPSGVALWRGRYRQIAAHGRAAGTPRCRTAHALALFLLAAAHRQRALSDHRPDGTCRRIGARRHPARRSSTSSMRCWHKPRPPNRMPRSLPRCCRCRTMDAIPRSTLLRSSAGRKRWKP